MTLSRSSKAFLAVLAGLVVLVGIGLYIIDGRVGGDRTPAGEPVEITVDAGQSVQAVGDALDQQGVVRSSLRFRRTAGEEQLDQELQPGIYELETGMGAEAAVEALLAGPSEPNSIRFTVPEGLAVEVVLQELDEAFDDHGVDDFRAVLDERTEAGENAPGTLQLPGWFPEPAEAGDEIVEPYEGVLFPETYEVGLDAGPREVLQLMVDQTATVMQEVLGAAEGDVDPYRTLIIASIVERESRVDAERARVAGVIQNRLEADRRLQVDATVLYARGEHTERVLIEDTEIDSPYNTYQVEGLPPTPIAAPGRSALQAAVSPEEHDELFYVLSPDCDGTHVFAEDEAGHQENVDAFRDAGGCR